MKFSYTALNEQNQKMTGVLEAESIDMAKEELHKMGLSIISISETSEEEFEKQKKEEILVKEEKGIKTFMFKAGDKQGKEIDGTIDAIDIYTAYKRLLTEYHFKVIELYPSGIQESEKAGFLSEMANWDTRLKAEGIDIEAELTKEGAMEEGAIKVDKKIIAEIDKFIINAKKVLSDYSERYSTPFVKEIEKTLGELERIRTSTNIKHISEVCNNLYELISNPDEVSEEASPASPEYKEIIDTMGGSTIVKKELDVYAKAVGLKRIQSMFDNMIKKLQFGGKEKELGKPEAPEGKISKLLKKFKPKEKPPKPSSGTGFMDVVKMAFSYLSAPNAVMRQARKQELSKTYNTWRKAGAKEKEKEIMPSEEKVSEMEGKLSEEMPSEKPSSKWDFTPLFVELDSFIGWLLFFYLIFFFLVNFSLEKGLGLPRDFIVKTLQSPLILNITIFLVFTHLIFKIKSQYFRHNALGSLFLFFLGFGTYTLLIINF